MDFTILWVIGITFGVLIAGFGFNYLRKRFKLDKYDILGAIDSADDALPFIKAIAIKLGLDKEKVEFYFSLTDATLEYLKTLDEKDKDIRINKAIEYIKILCLDVELTIDKSDEEIISWIAHIAYELLDKATKELE